ncbi:MAG TPA: type II toxin-antitoxin system VapC family toxin [Terriglobia bacterium]|nr:type II toxin-antitoxin system VapC family toxin [Terriglobia bacterium]
MRTAIDTNVISALWSASSVAAKVTALLGRIAGEGALAVCGPVYVELVAHPKATQQFVDQFLATTRVEVDFVLDEPVWRETAQRFADYARRRRKSGGGEARRLVDDFLIGAHASLHADRLLTFDSRFYAQDFPKLPLIGLEAL